MRSPDAFPVQLGRDYPQFERGSEEVATTERDVVTEAALLGIIVPNIRPPHEYDFKVMILADDTSGTRPGFLHLRVHRGKAEIVPHGGGGYPAHIPAWSLSALRALVLTDDGGVA